MATKNPINSLARPNAPDRVFAPSKEHSDASGAALLATTDKSSKSYAPLYKRLERLVTLAASGSIHGVFCTGSAGCGKTSLTISVLTSLGKVEGQDFIHIKGFASAMSFYELLYQNREGKIIVCDDVDSLLQGVASGNILKAALDDKPVRRISYISSRLDPTLPQSFEFSLRHHRDQQFIGYRRDQERSSASDREQNTFR